MTDQEIREALETLLFASPSVLSTQQLSQLIDTLPSSKITAGIHQLNTLYEENGRVFRIQNVAGGWQFRSMPEFRKWAHGLKSLKPLRLSAVVLETLSIIAYKQPITRTSIEHIRGVSASHALQFLMKHQLIHVVEKAPVPGRPSLYGTSKGFLELFGLQNIKNLPSFTELDMQNTSME